MNPLTGFTGQPDLDRDIAEERQRELLEELEAERLANGELVEAEDYQPVTDGADDLVDSRESNRHIHKD